VVVVGVAVTDEPLVVFKLPASEEVQVYVVPPVTLITVLSPKHTVRLEDGLIVNDGDAVTVIPTVVVFTQPVAVNVATTV
jgi:hypothetical protein